MATLEEQYEQFLTENPDSELTFEEWENSLENDWEEWEQLEDPELDEFLYDEGEESNFSIYKSTQHYKYLTATYTDITNRCIS